MHPYQTAKFCFSSDPNSAVATNDYYYVVRISTLPVEMWELDSQHV